METKKDYRPIIVALLLLLFIVFLAISASSAKKYGYRVVTDSPQKITCNDYLDKEMVNKIIEYRFKELKPDIDSLLGRSPYFRFETLGKGIYVEKMRFIKFKKNGKAKLRKDRR